jgi:hypothetical protein
LPCYILNGSTRHLEAVRGVIVAEHGEHELLMNILEAAGRRTAKTWLSLAALAILLSFPVTGIVSCVAIWYLGVEFFRSLGTGLLASVGIGVFLAFLFGIFLSAHVWPLVWPAISRAADAIQSN